MQDFALCGPWEEICIANQTLKDENCLVPCTGLYADISDDSLKQSTQALERYVTEGIEILFTTLSIYIKLYILH